MTSHGHRAILIAVAGALVAALLIGALGGLQRSNERDEAGSTSAAIGARTPAEGVADSGPEAAPLGRSAAQGSGAQLAVAQRALFAATTLPQLLDAVEQLPADDADARHTLNVASGLCLGNWASDPLMAFDQLRELELVPLTEHARARFVRWWDRRRQFCGTAAGRLTHRLNAVSSRPNQVAGEFEQLIAAIDGLEDASNRASGNQSRPALDGTVLAALEQTLAHTPSKERFLVAADRLARHDWVQFRGVFANDTQQRPDLRQLAAAELAACTWSQACGPLSLHMTNLCRDVQYCEMGDSFRDYLARRFGPEDLRGIEELSQRLLRMRSG